MRTLLLLLAIVAHPAFAQIGSKIQQTKITGIWQNSQFGYQMTLMLNEDGSGEFDGEQIKYAATGGKLSLTVVSQNNTTIYSFSQTANELTLSGGDLEQPVKFTRGGSGAPPVAATSSQPSQPVQAQNSGESTDKNLLGTWSGNNESMEFRADGKCVINGTAVDYKVSQGNIILATPQGQAMIAYAITGNEMKVTANGAQYTYTRGMPATGGSAPPAGRSVPQELAGKWCWINVGSSNASMSSECWTLRHDGTYSYYSESSRSVNTTTVTGGTASQGSDVGTWWVEGDRLFYASQTQGQGSYKLEKRNHPKNTGDPMIVLNGHSYVTATYRQPWR
jgi:hypothetical protein